MTDAQELRDLLSHHFGTEHYYSHAFNRACVYTDGVKDFAEHAGHGAYWLLDILLTQPEILKGMRTLGIVFINLRVKDGKAKLTVREDDGIPPLYERDIAFTDCPDGDWPFFFEADTLMLPGER